ncbi:chloride channel protein [Mangrovimicrobium sediminis]|uniref:chloride channel protein n=1 Tax=Mangrovimicrobium sediminis TaxID=2562682 RepID=UPI001F0E4E81|nr:chloride channel protein [Haliea sp. SAOS-164]
MPTLISKYRRYLTDYNSVLAYAVLGVIGGIASGLVVVLFEETIIQLAALLEVEDHADNFEALPERWRFALPALGALVLGIAFQFLHAEQRETGIVHVISRMHSHYGALPARNALVQFIAGAFALATGQSGGREGPGVHLGGAVNSLLGQRLSLPNNSLRMLIACGAAGSISAAFNTPLAGVIFAMEVIAAEYTVAGFIPVMLAAVAASAVARTINPGGSGFDIPPLELTSLWELPYVMLLGFVCGFAVVAFIRLSKLTARQSKYNVILRFAMAGCLTGAIALLVPEVMGIGYDTLTMALRGEIVLWWLLAIAAAKIIATAITAGVGMPVGVIGPNLLIGGCIGGALGIVGQQFMPDYASGPTLYVVLGMGAAMAAVLNAPLAALLAVIELTSSIGIGMPAMLAIVAANLTCSGLFRERSLHRTILRQLRRLVPDDPLNQLLHRTQAAAIMDSRVVRVPTELGADDHVTLLESTPTWCLVTREGEDLYLIRGDELLEWMALTPDAESFDVTNADIRRWTFTNVPLQASLRQVMDSITRRTTEAACIYERSRSAKQPVLHGVVTREAIEKFTLGRLQAEE